MMKKAAKKTEETKDSMAKYKLQTNVAEIAKLFESQGSMNNILNVNYCVDDEVKIDEETIRLHSFRSFVYSNYICNHYELTVGETYLPKFGRLGVGLMGIIARYIDYKDLMFKARYINKEWLLFTQKYLHFSNQQQVKTRKGETVFLRIAKLKVCVDKIYKGEDIMPILWHPYYTEAEEIDLFYEVSDIKLLFLNSKEASQTKLSYFDLFFLDIFKLGSIFSKTKKIKFYFTGESYYNFTNNLRHFKHFCISENLKNLEEVIINDHSRMLDLTTFQSMDKTNFPKLTNLSVPFLATVNQLFNDYYDQISDSQIKYFMYENWCAKIAGPSKLQIIGSEVNSFFGNSQISIMLYKN